MKINHNMSAMIANSQLLRSENSLSASIERLSSGLKINHASDDAAGMAIATKMRAQINGLSQASRNASDGISVLETADGALNEVHSMLQRMRELSVQAANEIYLQEDLEAVQAEIASLTDEIDRISTDTEFNKKKLLNGDLDQRVYTNIRGIDRIEISDSVASEHYNITVDKDARQAVLVGNATGNTVPEGVVTFNGVEVEITADEDPIAVFEKLREAAEQGEINLFAVDDPPTGGGDAEHAGYVPVEFEAGTTGLMFVSDRYGSSAEMKITCDNQALANFLGLPQEAIVKGTDAQISLGDGFGKQASYTTDGNNVVITDRNGFKLSFELDPTLAKTTFVDVTVDRINAAAPGTVLGPLFPTVRPGNGTPVVFDVTDIGTLTLQIGANENQIMDVRIPSTSAKALYIDKVDVSTVTGADRAIDTYDKAIARISETRSRIGAYQNRLESANTSLEATELNMTAALSRIEDTDMAKEMTTYTQYQILTQAATSVLAQANDVPQQALQLLQ